MRYGLAPSVGFRSAGVVYRVGDDSSIAFRRTAGFASKTQAGCSEFHKVAALRGFLVLEKVFVELTLT